MLLALDILENHIGNKLPGVKRFSVPGRKLAHVQRVKGCGVLDWRSIDSVISGSQSMVVFNTVIGNREKQRVNPTATPGRVADYKSTIGLKFDAATLILPNPYALISQIMPRRRIRRPLVVPGNSLDFRHLQNVRRQRQFRKAKWANQR